MSPGGLWCRSRLEMHGGQPWQSEHSWHGHCAVNNRALLGYILFGVGLLTLFYCKQFTIILQGEWYTSGMKPWIIGVIIVGILGALAYVYIKNQPPVMTSLPDGTVIYDVRTPQEFATSHVTSATLFPLADLQSGKLPTDSKDATIAIYCQSGRRSAIAVDILKKAGFKNVMDMHGIADTQNYGLSIVR